MIKTLNKILYVEDSPFIRKVTQIALETVGGFTLKVCEHGEEEKWLRKSAQRDKWKLRA